MTSIILQPHITEKAGALAEANNVYTFVVAKTATKKTITSAIRDLYKITPTKVTVVTKKNKKVFTRGKRGQVSGFKKAYVYLKKGDKIEFV